MVENASVTESEEEADVNDVNEPVTPVDDTNDIPNEIVQDNDVNGSRRYPKRDRKKPK